MSYPPNYPPQPQYGYAAPYAGAPQPQYSQPYPQQPQYGQPQYPAPFQQTQQSSFPAPPQPKQYQQNCWFAVLYNRIQPAEMVQLQAWFYAADRDRSGQITAKELAHLPYAGRPLGEDQARKLIKIFDKDYSGTIDFFEYASLQQFLNSMYTAFCAADRDRSGFLDAREIHSALAGAGFQLDLQTVNTLAARYMTPRGISFDNFIETCIHLALVRSIFDWNDVNRTGRITLTYDQLCQITINLTREPKKN